MSQLGTGDAPLRNALVPLVSVAPTANASGILGVDGRANARFVTHLLATAAQLPQTRARRRAEPDVATAAYRALGQWPTVPGRALSRSL
jgi:hypothetical protein